MPTPAIGRLGAMRTVPTVSRFFGIVMTMDLDDHGPPYLQPATPTTR